MLTKKIILFTVVLLLFFGFLPSFNYSQAQYACNQNCSLNPAGCAAGLSCIENVCRKASCSSDPACSCPYTCNQSCALGPSACVSGLTCYTSGASQRCRLPDCTSSTSCTCPLSWIKLKNTSFSSTNNLYNPIPVTIAAYDSDDDGTRYFNIASAGYDPGLVSASSIELNGDLSSTKGWQATMAKTVSMTPSNFLNYIKSRKEFKTLTDINDITTEDYDKQVLVLTGPITIDDTNKSIFNNRSLVLVINGNLNFNPTTFNPTGGFIAFLTTGTITFANSTTEARGIFVAPNINLG
ncbi:MAG: hypothetical protein AAB876_00995, partial [Patescibacteria group bacterium]